MNSLCKLPNFRVKHLYDFIRVRLNEYKWNGGVEKFITQEAFLALALASSNHPRRAVRILAEALKTVAKNKQQAHKIIDLDSMRIATFNAKNSLDEKDWIVLSYLLENGQSSASDDKLRQALKFKKSKRADGYHTSVDRRLRSVSENLLLDFEVVPTGNTKKKVLHAPAIPGW